jgi:dihydrofolate reductase
MPIISLVVAIAKNRAIGKDNHLLCHLPEDMRHFREVTLGKPVIMGRKTWESLPDAFRPLPGRPNIVVSRNAAYQAEGATVVSSLEEAIAQAGNVEQISIIGGADIFRLALPIADVLDMTEIDASFDADTFFPEFSPEDWQEMSRQTQKSQNGLTFSFVEYRRR